jgi:hypothetical protein
MGNPATRRTFFTAIISALFYGSWALYINYNSDRLWQSVITQAACSFIGGLLVAVLVEKTFKALEPPWRVPAAAFGPYSLALFLFLLAHLAVGSENPLLLLVPNALLGTVYFYVYSLRLSIQAKSISPG